MRKNIRNIIGTPPQPPVPAGGWQIIYTGFALIMLSFFILLTSFASFQDAKVARFAKAFSSAVSVFQQDAGILPGEIRQDIEGALIARQNRIARLFEKVQELGQHYQLADVDIRRSDRGVVLTLSDKLLFSSGQAQLTRNAHPLLKNIGKLISGVGVPVEIEGHTDNVPIQTSAYPSNWELSTARAINVLRFLIQQENLDPALISAAGRSEYDPVMPNDSERHRSANRRVAFIFGVN